MCPAFKMSTIFLAMKKKRNNLQILCTIFDTSPFKLPWGNIEQDQNYDL